MFNRRQKLMRESSQDLKYVQDWNYKLMVLDHFDKAKTLLISTAQNKFEKSMVQGCYLSVSSVSYMILPFVSDTQYNIKSFELKNRILEMLQELENEYEDVQSYDLIARANYVHRLEQILSLLPPLFSFIGMYVRTTKVGVFAYTEKEGAEGEGEERHV